MNGLKFDVAIVGAGLAGATAASALSRRGKSVIVLEKSRGAGGRMSSRRVDGLTFDHGAQYFTARDPDFKRQVARWQKAGVVQTWQARIGVISEAGITPTQSSTTRFVGVPGMTAPCKQLLHNGITCRFRWTATSARKHDDGWLISADNDTAVLADTLICTVPPAQAQNLLEHEGARKAVENVALRPCWAVMVQLEGPLLSDWDGVFVNAGPLSWIAAQNSRPERPTSNSWVLHASPAWSQQHLEASPAQIIDTLLSAAFELPGAQRSAVALAVAHRWRYSIAVEPLDEGAIHFSDDKLVLAGDWCHGSRVEGAWLSGAAAARYI